MSAEDMREREVPQSPEVANGVVLMAVLGFLVFVALAMTGLFVYIRMSAPEVFRTVKESPFPQPALQTRPQLDWKTFEAAQRQSLSGYAWIDQTRGIARIPIADAMKAIVARGTQAYDPLAQTSAKPDASNGGAR